MPPSTPKTVSSSFTCEVGRLSSTPRVRCLTLTTYPKSTWHRRPDSRWNGCILFWQCYTHTYGATLNTAVHTQRFPTLTKLPSAIFQSNSSDFSVHLFVMLFAAEWMTGCLESPSCRCLRHSCDNSDARRLESEIFFRLQGQCAVSSPFSPTLAVELSLIFFRFI